MKREFIKMKILAIVMFIISFGFFLLNGALLFWIYKEKKGKDKRGKEQTQAKQE